MSETHAAQEYRYWAFISYSNKDRSWAGWLHRAIESYSIPAQMVGHETPVGEPAPKRFYPVFLDREELPASSDLGREIENALHASRYLIIVCSPHAAQSRWVNREIEAFSELGRDNRILAFIVDGEPHSGGAQECFPAALKRIEPIAADARPQGDGRANARLKLLAGMLGVSFDALKQRDAQRQIRRLQVMVAVAFVLVLAFAGLAWYANEQREKAVAARLEAESVLEFLLYDLHEVLEPVGRLDIIEKVEKRVDEYYRKLGVEADQPRTLHNRWLAAVHAGDLARGKGNLDSALTEYRTALAIAKRLVVAEPSNTIWERDLGITCMKVGDVLLVQGDLSGALREYQAGLASFKWLEASNPLNTEWQHDLAASHERIGDVFRAQNDLDGALREYQTSLAILERLERLDSSNSQWQRDLADNHGKIGGVLETKGALDGALREYRASHAIMEKLVVADPSNTEWQRDLSVSYEKIGGVLKARGDLDGALREYRAGQAIIEKLATADPLNAEWQRDLTVSHGRVGEVLEMQGNLDEALTEYHAGLAIIERLAASDASNAQWQRDLWVTYSLIAAALENSGDSSAMEWWQRTYDVLLGMKRAGMDISPADERYYQQLRQKLGY